MYWQKLIWQSTGMGMNNDLTDPALANWQSILLDEQSTVSEKAIALYSILERLDYELPDEEKDRMCQALDRSIQTTLDDIWEPFYMAPAKYGRWAGEPKDSIWIPDSQVIPQNKVYSNIHGKSWGQILEDYQCLGIPFSRGKADFSSLAIHTVRIENFSELMNPVQPGVRSKLHIEATLKAGLSIEELEEFKKNKYPVVWHEDVDCRTMHLVPQEIHGNVPHYGGIYMLDVLRRFKFI